jgi:hypothetical protein
LVVALTKHFDGEAAGNGLPSKPHPLVGVLGSICAQLTNVRHQCALDTTKISLEKKIPTREKPFEPSICPTQHAVTPTTDIISE